MAIGRLCHRGPMSKRKTNVCEELLLNKVVLRPDKGHSRQPESLGRPFEAFDVQSGLDGRRVSGWYFPTEPTGPIALVNPSNRGTKADALEHVAVLAESGCGVLLYDYQGFGDSEGLADVRTLTGDGQAVLAWAVRRGLWTASRRRLILGLSLGSLVAIRLAATDERSATGLVLDGAIEPFGALRRSFGPLGAVVAEVACSQVPEDLNSGKQIQAVSCPILFVHGRLDTISAAEDVAHLAGRAPHATIWMPDDCGHLDAVTRHRDEYRRQLEPFLAAPSVR